MSDDLIDIRHVSEIVRKKFGMDDNAEDYEDGQRMLAARERVGMLPTPGARTIKSLSPDVFDGNTALSEAKSNMEILRERRLGRLSKGDEK